MGQNVRTREHSAWLSQNAERRTRPTGSGPEHQPERENATPPAGPEPNTRTQNADQNEKRGQPPHPPFRTSWWSTCAPVPASGGAPVLPFRPQREHPFPRSGPSGGTEVPSHVLRRRVRGCTLMYAWRALQVRSVNFGGIATLAQQQNIIKICGRRP